MTVYSNRMFTLRDTNRTRLALELLVVVIGILMALGLDRLNQDRVDRQIEQAYFAQLIDDLESDVVLLDSAIGQANKHADAALRVLAVIEDGSGIVADKQAFAWDVNYSGYIAFFYPTDFSYRDLTSTGNMDLIRDTDLKRSIVGYYENIEYSEQFYEAWIDQAWKRLNPTLQNLLHPDDWRVIEASLSRGNSWMPDDSVDDLLDIERVIDSIRNSVPAQNMFVSVVVASREAQNLFGKHKMQAEALLAELNTANDPKV